MLATCFRPIILNEVVQCTAMYTATARRWGAWSSMRSSSSDLSGTRRDSMRAGRLLARPKASNLNLPARLLPLLQKPSFRPLPLASEELVTLTASGQTSPTMVRRPRGKLMLASVTAQLEPRASSRNHTEYWFGLHTPEKLRKKSG